MPRAPSPVQTAGQVSIDPHIAVRADADGDGRADDLLCCALRPASPRLPHVATHVALCMIYVCPVKQEHATLCPAERPATLELRVNQNLT